MSTIFTKIINGEIPGRFIWRDDVCVAFLDAFPLTQGHVLVVPVQEVDKWTEASDELMAHLWKVVGIIGKAQMQTFPCERIGVMVAGYEVPHLHIHSFPTTKLQDFDLANKNMDPDAAQLDEQAMALRTTLMTAGYEKEAGDVGA